MWQTLKDSISDASPTNSMDLLVTLCVLFAIFVGFVATITWVIFVCRGKDVPSLMQILGLCGTFLAPLIPKTVSSFSKKPYIPPAYPEDKEA